MSKPDAGPYGGISEVTELVVGDIVVLSFAVDTKRRHHVTATVAEGVVDYAGVDAGVGRENAVIAIVYDVMAESDVGCVVSPKH